MALWHHPVHGRQGRHRNLRSGTDRHVTGQAGIGTGVGTGIGTGIGTAEPPLAGVRVVELTAIGPVPHAVMILGDLGAEVVRIERPDRGELQLIPSERDPVLRNRRLLRADLTDPSGLADVRRVIDRADVLVEGFRPGTAERLGLGPDEVCATNPGLIYGRMTGWGQDGPAAQTAGHDLNYLSMTGALHAMGRRGERPPVPLNLIADYGGGSMFLVVGVLAALVERSRSGRGQVIDAAMVDGVSVLLQPLQSWRSAGLVSEKREDNLLDGGAPYYDTYTCSDGEFVAVSAIEYRFYRELLTGLGLRGQDVPNRDDHSNWPALRELFTGIFASRARDHWARVFAGTDACVTPVLTVAEAENDPHLTARGEFHHQNGQLEVTAAPRFSRSASGGGGLAQWTNLDDVLAGWQARSPQE